jgi:hypothetical protein
MPGDAAGRSEEHPGMRPLRPPVPPTDQVVLEFGATTSWHGWTTAAVASVLWLGIGLVAAFSGQPGVSVVVLLLGGLAGAVALLLFRVHHFRIVLTATRLILPRYVWGWDVVELRAVAGVGMRFFDPPPPRVRGEGGRVTPMWRLGVWRTDLSAVSLPLSVRSTDLPPLPPAPDPDDLMALSGPLAESWPGQVAREIADQVTAVSAPDPSPLDQRHYEASAPVLYAEKAYWSPDGRMGLLR